jgi:excinuclease ABC subunit B
MREAAADLEFETAARLRDEIKRLRETELAIADDPMTRQSDVDDRTGGYRGERKYGASANLPPASRIAAVDQTGQPTDAQPSSRVKKPSLDDMGPGTDRAVPRREAAASPSRPRNPGIDPRTKAGAFGENIAGPHKPTLDEMGPHASLPVKSGKPLPQKPQLPTRTIEIEDPGETRSRRGRPKKTGRPGR